MMRVTFAILAIFGIVLASDGGYGLLHGIEQSEKRLRQQSEAIVEGHVRPEDAYGRILYDSIVSTPQDTAMAMRAVAIIQVVLGLSLAILGLVLFLRARSHDNRKELRY